MKDRLTTDHFTPKCIGKILGWSNKQINSPDNLQELPWPIHAAKDALTPTALKGVQLQKQGATITLWSWHNEQVLYRKTKPYRTNITLSHNKRANAHY